MFFDVCWHVVLISTPSSNWDEVLESSQELSIKFARAIDRVLLQIQDGVECVIDPEWVSGKHCFLRQCHAEKVWDQTTTLAQSKHATRARETLQSHAIIPTHLLVWRQRWYIRCSCSLKITRHSTEFFGKGSKECAGQKYAAHKVERQNTRLRVTHSREWRWRVKAGANSSLVLTDKLDWLKTLDSARRHAKKFPKTWNSIGKRILAFQHMHFIHALLDLNVCTITKEGTPKNIMCF